ncbi:PEP-CTERM sorting domain-containing protein [Rubripirellula obstinata]|nr:PEP-CTERM sorting domain-containing protein [Rubripirellula obstinata]
MKKLIFTLVGALMLTGTASADIVIDTTASPQSSFGAPGGLFIDFDATPSTLTGQTVTLTENVTYSVDSIGLVGSSQNTQVVDLFLGVYSGYDGTDLTGFLGASDAAATFGGGDGSPINYTFTGITVTSNADLADTSDRLFFAFQNDATAIPAILDLPGNNVYGLQAVGSFAGGAADPAYLVSVVQDNGTIRNDRALVASVGTTVIPEPSSLAILGVAGVCGLVRRRRK